MRAGLFFIYFYLILILGNSYAEEAEVPFCSESGLKEHLITVTVSKKGRKRMCEHLLTSNNSDLANAISDSKFPDILVTGGSIDCSEDGLINRSLMDSCEILVPRQYYESEDEKDRAEYREVRRWACQKNIEETNCELVSCDSANARGESCNTEDLRKKCELFKPLNEKLVQLSNTLTGKEGALYFLCEDTRAKALQLCYEKRVLSRKKTCKRLSLSPIKYENICKTHFDQMSLSEKWSKCYGLPHGLSGKAVRSWSKLAEPIPSELKIKNIKVKSLEFGKIEVRFKPFKKTSDDRFIELTIPIKKLDTMFDLAMKNVRNNKEYFFNPEMRLFVEKLKNGKKSKIQGHVVLSIKVENTTHIPERAFEVLDIDVQVDPENIHLKNTNVDRVIDRNAKLIGKNITRAFKEEIPYHICEDTDVAGLTRFEISEYKGENCQTVTIPTIKNLQTKGLKLTNTEYNYVGKLIKEDFYFSAVKELPEYLSYVQTELLLDFHNSTFKESYLYKQFIRELVRHLTKDKTVDTISRKDRSKKEKSNKLIKLINLKIEEVILSKGKTYKIPVPWTVQNTINEDKVNRGMIELKSMVTKTKVRHVEVKRKKIDGKWEDKEDYEDRVFEQYKRENEIYNLNKEQLTFKERVDSIIDVEDINDLGSDDADSFFHWFETVYHPRLEGHIGLYKNLTNEKLIDNLKYINKDIAQQISWLESKSKSISQKRWFNGGKFDPILRLKRLRKTIFSTSRSISEKGQNNFDPVNINSVSFNSLNELELALSRNGTCSPDSEMNPPELRCPSDNDLSITVSLEFMNQLLRDLNDRNFFNICEVGDVFQECGEGIWGQEVILSPEGPPVVSYDRPTRKFVLQIPNMKVVVSRLLDNTPLFGGHKKFFGIPIPGMGVGTSVRDLKLAIKLHAKDGKLKFDSIKKIKWNTIDLTTFFFKRTFDILSTMYNPIVGIPVYFIQNSVVDLALKRGIVDVERMGEETVGDIQAVSYSENGIRICFDPDNKNFTSIFGSSKPQKEEEFSDSNH
jgi:hypothetical protein